LTGDRVTVGLTSTYPLPHRKKLRFSSHERCVVPGAQPLSLVLGIKLRLYGAVE
jgi:hypothetical protein